MATNLRKLSNADLVGFHKDAIAGARAALELDDDALYAAACTVTKAFREELHRRETEAVLAGDQAALDALNAAKLGVSIAEIEASR